MRAYSSTLEDTKAHFWRERAEDLVEKEGETNAWRLERKKLPTREVQWQSGAHLRLVGWRPALKAPCPRRKESMLTAVTCGPRRRGQMVTRCSLSSVRP